MENKTDKPHAQGAWGLKYQLALTFNQPSHVVGLLNAK